MTPQRKHHVPSRRAENTESLGMSETQNGEKPMPGTTVYLAAKTEYTANLLPHVDTIGKAWEHWQHRDDELRTPLKAVGNLAMSTTLLLNSTDSIVKDIPFLGERIGHFLGEIPLVKIIVRPVEKYRNKRRFDQVTTDIQAAKKNLALLGSVASHHAKELQNLRGHLSALESDLDVIAHLLAHQQYSIEYFQQDVQSLWKNARMLWANVSAIWVCLVVIVLAGAFATYTFYTKMIYFEERFKESIAQQYNQVYTVKVGDDLGKIAKKQCGDVSLAMLLYEANKKTIGTDPNKIAPKQKLIIPCNPQSASHSPLQ